jgi:hypothetical protein
MEFVVKALSRAGPTELFYMRRKKTDSADHTLVVTSDQSPKEASQKFLHETDDADAADHSRNFHDVTAESVSFRLM